VDPLTCTRMMEEIAGLDAAAAWMLMVANSGSLGSAPAKCARLP
jgi:hypothetical protein